MLNVISRSSKIIGTYKFFELCRIFWVLVYIFGKHPGHLAVPSFEDLKVPVAHVSFVELVSQLLIPKLVGDEE